MAGEKFIALEETSQAIKLQADNIKSVVDIINGKPSPSVFDIRNYIPIHDGLTIQPSEGGSGGTVFLVKQITGEGFLTDVHMWHEATITAIGYVQITIDDVIVLKSGIQQNYVSGLFNYPSLIARSSSAYPTITTSLTATAPTVNTAGTASKSYKDLANNATLTKNLYLNNPLAFKNNCKVEFISAKSFSPTTIFAEIKGGLKI